MKGQAEIIVVVAIIAVAIVVVYYAVQTPPLPPVPQGMELAKATVDGFILEAGRKTIENMEEYGGFLEPQEASAMFLNKPRTYWLVNGAENIPDLESNLVSGVEGYLKENKAYLEQALEKDYPGAAVSEPSVTANLLADSIDITVRMKVETKKGELSVFRVSPETGIKKIYEFSRMLVQEEKARRYFEYFTVASFMASPIEGGQPRVPVNVLLAGCGQFIMKTWDDVRPAAEDAIRTTVAHTYLPGKYPTGVMETTPFPKYSLASFQGTEYAGLDVSFQLPDSFGLDYSNFDMTPDPINLYAKPIPMIGECISDAEAIEYDLFYPVVVEVKDSGTGRHFRFALPVYIVDNLPGKWTDGGTAATDLQTLVCASRGCDSGIAVKDSSGAPVPGASVSFMGCRIGLADSNGLVDGKMPCGAGYLEVRKGGYGYHREMLSYSEAEGREVVLYKHPVVSVKLFEAVVQNHSDIGEYWIPKGNIEYIDNNEARDETVHMTFMTLDDTYCQEDSVYCERFFTGPSGRIENMRPLRYRAVATMYNPEITVSYGSAIGNLELREDMDGKELYVYIPHSLEFQNAQDAATKAELAALLTMMLKQCGIGPMSEKEIDLEDRLPCIVKYSDLGE